MEIAQGGNCFSLAGLCSRAARRLLAAVALLSMACLVGASETSPASPQSAPYYWTSTPVAHSAQLITLFRKQRAAGSDIPVVAVLKDTLGDADSENDRLVYVWLLDYSPLSWHQRALAAVPFFYWRVGRGSDRPEKGDVRPLLNLATPLHPVISDANRQVLQWTLFDPMTSTVRATTRAYTENQTDHERIRLEEAISYLSKAPSEASPGLSQREVDLLIARLSLRKRLLGGLVANANATRLGDEERLAAERVRLRNWEYLREAAERAGLIFEPLTLSGVAENYALVWYRVGSVPPPIGPDDSPVWRILHIQNPWKDERLNHWKGPTVQRNIDGENSRLIPLAAYSLSYPRMPLLMIDFRSESRVRRHEMAQRGIDQLVSGILGLSHFGNWYYFAGADAYSFIATRRGAALNRDARLDSYAQFRTALTLDTTLPADLRITMLSRLNQLAMNPLDASPETEVQTARARYSKLQAEIENGELLKRLELERRQEVAEFGKGGGHLALDSALHVLTFGSYTHRARANSVLLARLDRDRRVDSNLLYLDQVVRAGASPEVSFDAARVSVSINELSSLLPDVRSARVRAHAVHDLTRIESLTNDSSLRADCSFALRSVTGELPPGIAARPRALGPENISALDGKQ